MKIALAGGTFDPVHNGHLLPLLEIAPKMGWEQIHLIPARVQPFKLDRDVASEWNRYAMLVLATTDNPIFRVSTIELERDVISYTVDTLEEWRRTTATEVTIDWVIGDDNLAMLDQWRNVDRIVELANFVILRRGGDRTGFPERFEERITSPEKRSTHGNMVFADNERIEISSTEIRKRIDEGKSLSGLVPGRVEEFVQRYGLYR